MLHQAHKRGVKTYIIYDERARHGGVDQATTLDSADSKKEAFQVVRRLWPEGVIFEYEDDGSGKLINGKQLN